MILLLTYLILSETMKEVMDLIEEARFYWTDQGAGITMDLLPGTIGVLLLLGGTFECQKR